MKIQVVLFASLLNHLPENADREGWMVETEENVTLDSFLANLRIPMDKVKLIFLNNVHAKGSEILKDGDRVGLFPPVAGG